MTFFFFFNAKETKIVVIPTAPEIAPVDPEQAPLLAAEDGSADTNADASPVDEVKGWRFYLVLFSHRGFFTGVSCFLCFSILIASFSTTLPLHVQDVFNFNTFQMGLLFAALEGPGMVLSPLFGWFKDRYGSRIPTAVGFFSAVPLLWLLGVPGEKKFEWANVGSRGEIIYESSILALGCLLCLINGVGMMEVTCEFFCPPPVQVTYENSLLTKSQNFFKWPSMTLNTRIQGYLVRKVVFPVDCPCLAWPGPWDVY